MRASRLLPLLAGTAAIAFASLAVAAPAAGATLPDGQRITIVQWLDSSDPGEGQFFDVNPATAAATPVGTPTGHTIVGIDVDDDGKGYALGQAGYGDAGLQPVVWKADAVTGTVTDQKLISLTGDFELDSCDGIVLLPNGELIVSCIQNLGNVPISHTGVLDTSGEGAVLTPFMSTSLQEFQSFYALAHNPVTGELWGFGPVDGDASFLIDRENGTSEFVAFMDEDVYAADFDRNGQLFISSDLYDGSEFEWPALGVADPFTGEFSFLEWYLDTRTDTVLTLVAALTVWGKPALAATGSTGSELVLPVSLGSALLLLAGGACIATTRVQRRAEA